MVLQFWVRVTTVTALMVLFFFDSHALLAEEVNANHTGVSTDGACQEAKGPYDVHRWFAEYDAIRRRAKMGLMDKFQSSRLLLFTFDPMFVFGGDAHPLLHRMIRKYTEAVEKMESLTRLPETQELHEGYLRYFKDALALFIDLKESENSDPVKREKGLSGVMQRKRELEVLDQANKKLDVVLRKRYDIPPIKG